MATPSYVDASILTWVVSMALIDSVDPCIFAMYASILASSMLAGTREAVKVGSTFIASIYAGYFLFGLLLRVASMRLPVWLLATLVLAYGVVNLALALRGREGKRKLVCREDDIPCRLASAFNLAKLVKSPLWIAVLGFIASFTLLPCSAGLYVLYQFVTGYYNYPFSLWIPLTMLYVAVFVLPLVLILLAFMGLSSVIKLHEVLLARERLVKVVGSAIMVSAAIYMYAFLGRWEGSALMGTVPGV